MPDPLVDIGGGFKIVNPQSLMPSGGSGVGDVLQLLNLQQKMVELPQIMKKRQLDIKKTEQDIELQDNAIANIEIDNQKKRLDLNLAVSEENRKRSTFMSDQIKNSMDLFRVDPRLGALGLRQVFPDAQITQEGAAYKAKIPSQAGDAEFLIDPNKILDPKERLSFENSERERFIQNSKDFKERSDNFRNMIALKNDETGSSDIAIMSNFAKIQDPGGRVTGSDVALAIKAAGFSQALANAWTRAATTGGPIFGQKGAPTRQAFIDTVTKQMRNFTEDMIHSGKFTVDLARQRGLDGKAVVAPIGGLMVEDFLPEKELTTEQLQERVKRQQGLGMQ